MAKILLGVIAIVVASSAQAQWSGESSAGYLVTSGNADTTSLNLKQVVELRRERWKDTVTAAAVNTGDEVQTTAERYSVSNQIDYNFSQRNYAFGVLEYEKDVFGGIRERSSQAVGYGRHVLTGPVHTLDAEVGAGVRQTRTNLTREESDDAVGRAGATYAWKVSETTRLEQGLKVEGGTTNTLSESSTELKLAIIGNLAAVLGYNVRHNSGAPIGTTKLDTTAGATLTYAFGETK